jgi:hypothetical protein
VADALDLVPGLGEPRRSCTTPTPECRPISVLFIWLRLRSGSLLAPVLLHLATKTLGAVDAAAAHRLG